MERKWSMNLLEATKLAYRKHHLGDESVGWGELSEALCNALCNEMGDKGFQRWLRDLPPIGTGPSADQVQLTKLKARVAQLEAVLRDCLPVLESMEALRALLDRTRKAVKG